MSNKLCHDSYKRLKEWLNSGDKHNVPKLIAYPSDSKQATTTYTLYSDHDRLIQSIKWLDVSVAIKLIESEAFDLNLRDNRRFGSTELNKLCISSNTKYDSHRSELVLIMTALIKNDEIDLNTKNDFGRTPLGNSIRKNRRDFSRILLQFGCGLNEDAIKSIIPQIDNGNMWIFELIKELRAEYSNGLLSILKWYHVDDIMDVVLDFILPPNDIQQRIQRGYEELKYWLEKDVKLINMMTTFINVGVLTLNGFELTQQKLQRMNLDKGIQRKILETLNIKNGDKKQELDPVWDFYPDTDI